VNFPVTAAKPSQGETSHEVYPPKTSLSKMLDLDRRKIAFSRVGDLSVRSRKSASYARPKSSSARGASVG
jgi:hypothetical protein